MACNKQSLSQLRRFESKPSILKAFCTRRDINRECSGTAATASAGHSQRPPTQHPFWELVGNTAETRRSIWVPALSQLSPRYRSLWVRADHRGTPNESACFREL